MAGVETTEKEDQVIEAFHIMRDHGFYIIIPGWFDINDELDVLRFLRSENNSEAQDG